MSEQIINILTELKRQWGEIYVVSQETTATINSIQTELDAIARSANFWCNFALICACVGFVLTIGVASMMVWRRLYERED